MLPLIFLGLFIGLAVIRAIHQRTTPSGEASQAQQTGRAWDRVRIALSGLLSLVVVIYGFHHVFGLFPWFAAMALPVPAWLRWIGAAGAVASLVMLHQVHRDLGVAFSVRLLVREDHPLITNGWYARIRHPMYSALAGFFLSASLVAAHALILGPCVAIAAILCARTGAEERMMEAHFGEEYRRYQDRSGRLWPRLTPRTRRD